MGYKLEYAGFKLHDIVKINKISTSILPSRENFSKTIPVNDGSFYSGYRYSEREIEVDIGIPTKSKKEYNDVVKKLSYILDVKSPSRLIIDESDISYYAVISGETQLEKSFQTGSVKLKFLCHDPVGYNKDYTGLKMEGKEFLFEDMGTYSSYPIFGFNFTKPSTFLFLTNENGESLMVGSKFDATIPSKPSTNVPVDDNCQDSSTFLYGGNSIISDNRAVDGNYGVGNGGRSIVATSYGNDVSNKWVGPTFRRNIGKSLEQFEVRVNISFSSQGKNFSEPNPKDLVRVAKKSGLPLLEEENDKSRVLGIVPYGTQFNVIKFGVKGYHLAYVNYQGTYGWLDTNYLWRININNPTRSSAEGDMEYAEDQMGLLEVLGYDDSGQLLFRFHLRDDNKYFEHVLPEVYVRDERVLYPGAIIPTPNTIMEKDDSGRVIGVKPVQSGVFGDWNDYTGTFTMRRKKIGEGKYRWWAKIARTEDGVNISREIDLGPGIIKDHYPKGKLNNLVFYIAKYNGSPAVSMMGINHVTVLDISNEDGEMEEEEVNLEIFKEGDLLEIDCEKCDVTLNGETLLNRLDLGSQFFKVNNNSRVLVRSDDENVTGSCSYRKRYI